MSKLQSNIVVEKKVLENRTECFERKKVILAEAYIFLENKMVSIIFNYILRLTFQSLEVSPNIYIVENSTILLFFKNVYASANIIYNQSLCLN